MYSTSDYLGSYDYLSSSDEYLDADSDDGFAYEEVN